MCSEPLNLLRLVYGFHQPQRSQSVAQHTPTSRASGHSGPVVRLRRCHFPDHPSRRTAPAHAGLRLCPNNVTDSQDFLLGAVHEQWTTKQSKHRTDALCLKVGAAGLTKTPGNLASVAYCPKISGSMLKSPATIHSLVHLRFSKLSASSSCWLRSVHSSVW